MTDEPIADVDLEPTDAEVSAEPESDEPTPPRAKITLRRSGVVTDIAFEFGSPATLGRFDPAVGPIDVDLGTIDEGAYISRRHAKFVCEDGQWKVADLGSSNGVYVLRDDFERVEETDLAEGDVVVFGNAQFVFSVLG